MKFSLPLLFLFFSTLVMADVRHQYSDDKNQAQEFLIDFLGLTKAEQRLFKKIEIKKTNLSDGLSGYTSPHSNQILIRHALQGSSQESTIVHEMIHQFTYTLKTREDEMIMEGMALLGEFLYLKKYYDKELAILSFLPLIEAALQKETFSLLTFNKTASEYGKSFLYCLFLYENFYGSDFTSAYFHSNWTGLEGLTKSADLSATRRLIPANWKKDGFIQAVFFWSILNRKIMLATRMNDSFSQVVGMISKNKIEEITQVEFLMKGFSSRSFTIFCKDRVVFKDLSEIHPYDITSEKTFINGNEVTSGVFFFINSGSKDVKISWECI